MADENNLPSDQSLSSSTASRIDRKKNKENGSSSLSYLDNELETDQTDASAKSKKYEKPLIPNDFYYDVRELWRRPFKSSDELPDDLITIYHSFGYPCQMRNNLHAIDTKRLMYAAGSYLQIIHIDQSPYKFEYLPTTGGGSIGALALHPNGKLFAVGEKSSSPTVNIFTTDGYRLYRILRDGTAVEYQAVSFNETGDLLASQGGDPDYMLTIWNWKQESILLRCKAFSQEVNHVTFNRDLPGALTTAGIGHIKFWNMAKTFTGLKLKGFTGRFGKTAISDIEGYVEFSDGKVLSGSDWGNMLLWDEHLIKLQISRKHGKPCHNGRIMQMMIVEGEILTAGTDGFVRSWNLELIDILETDEESGMVEIEAMCEVLIGQKVQLYYLTQPMKISADEDSCGTELEEKKSSEDELARHRWYCQDGAGGIWQADLSFTNTALTPKRLFQFHGGVIVACAVSPLTYLLMTLSEDGSLHLYDFLEKRLLAVRKFQAKGSALLWIPLCVDRKCATVMTGFSDGGIRQIAIDGSAASMTTHGRLSCQLKLMQALKPHKQTVTSFAYSYFSVEDDQTTFVTSSEDMTLFFFKVESEDNYVPICYVPLAYVPRRVQWSPDQATSKYLMVTCDDGVIIEMIRPLREDTIDSLICTYPILRIYQFSSIKSQTLHDEELARQEEIEKKKQEEIDAINKKLIEDGIETPSQQELRLAHKIEVAESLSRSKEVTEEPWKPYIPPVPSPILQTVYMEANSKFWLSLGDYDAGFLYECEFTQPFKQYEKPVVDKTPPVRAVRLADAEEERIWTLCFNSDGTCIFFGLEGGLLRLQFLETEWDISTDRYHWSMGIHDVSADRITNICLSHDESFLITTGEDGNIFIFSLLPPESFGEEFGTMRAKIPAGEEITKEVNDLIPDQYTIEEARERYDADIAKKLVDKHKQDQRAKIARQRTKFKHLLNMNNSMPPEYQLSLTEFNIDPERPGEIQREAMEKVEDVKKEMAWDSEKINLTYEKLRRYFMDTLLSDRFCVRAIKTPHIIYSYRTLALTRPKGLFQTPKPSVAYFGTFDDERSDDAEDEDGELRKLQEGFQLSGLSFDLPRRTKYLLNLAQEKRIKRAKRKIAWKKFLKTKPPDDLEDPADLEDINYAYETLGNKSLKSDSDYIVPDTYRLTMLDGSKRLYKCEKRLLELQSDFNAKLVALSNEKSTILGEIRKAAEEMVDVYEQMNVNLLDDALFSDEKPGGKFFLSIDKVQQLKHEAQGSIKRKKRVGSHERMDHRLFPERFRARSSVAIAKESFSKTQDFLGSRSGTKSTLDPFAAVALEETLSAEFDPSLSPMERELKAIQQIELAYRESELKKKMNEKETLFDEHHRQLRLEKMELDVKVKVGQLRVNILQQEQLMLMECENMEQAILDQINVCQEQRNDVEKSTKALITQQSRLNKDLDELSRKEKALFSELEQIIGESQLFRDYLVKVYRKKIKRKNVTRSEEAEEDESTESPSESSEYDIDFDEDDEESCFGDFTTCPPDCDEEKFNAVVELRESRLDLEEAMTEIKRNKESVQKDLDAFAKKRQAAELSFNKAQQELQAFQIEKQQRLNGLDMACMLHLHQIQCLRKQEFLFISNELCISEEEVLRLQERIRQLQVERKEEKRKTDERRKRHYHLQYAKERFLNKMARIDELCDKEMVAKFGKVVDLEVVETVVGDPVLEDVRSRLTQLQKGCDKDIQDLHKQIFGLRRENIFSIRLDSEYKYLEASLRSNAIRLEKNLNAVIANLKKRKKTDSFERPDDTKELLDIIASQREIIKDLTLEIHMFRDKLTL